MYSTFHNSRWVVETDCITLTSCSSSWMTDFSSTRKYYPSSKQFRDPPRYSHQQSMQQKVPFSLIRCSSSKVAFCSCVEWGWHIYNIVESESDPLTRRAVDLFEKEPLKGNSEVHLHTPTKFGEDRSKDLGGDREQTDRQTNRQTDKRCSIYSMMSTNEVLTLCSYVTLIPATLAAVMTGHQQLHNSH